MNSRPGLSRVTIASASLRPLEAIIADAGIAPGAVLEATRLPADFFAPPHDKTLTLADYFRLCEQIALAVGDETIHVSLRPLMLGTSDFIRDRLRVATTVRQMLDILAKSYNIIHGGAFNRVGKARDDLVFAMDDSDFPFAHPKDDAFILISLEALLVYVHVLLQSSNTKGDALPLRSIRTRRAKTREPSPLAHWGVPIVHGAPHFALHYAARAGDWPVDPTTCPVLGARTIYGGIARALDGLAAPDAIGGDIVARTRQALLDGLHDQRALARHLGMSTASHRRRLGELGTNFRDLRAETMRKAAIRRLESGASVAMVADELGFSDGRSFARAFRSWTGQSPRQYTNASTTD